MGAGGLEEGNDAAADASALAVSPGILPAGWRGEVGRSKENASGGVAAGVVIGCFQHRSHTHVLVCINGHFPCHLCVCALKTYRGRKRISGRVALEERRECRGHDPTEEQGSEGNCHRHTNKGRHKHNGSCCPSAGKSFQ